MQRKSFFKTVFLVLSGLFGTLLLFSLVLAVVGRQIDPGMPISMSIFLTLAFIFVAAILVATAVFVYKDAPKHGMDPWMWMTIAVFVPNLIGLIIYLIVRKNNTYEKQCINCQKPVNSEFKLCPYCGSEFNTRCPECGREVSKEWVVCPHCSKNLK